MIDKELYTIEEVLKITSLTKEALMNYVSKEILIGEKSGQELRFKKKDIIKFMNKEYENIKKGNIKNEVIAFMECSGKKLEPYYNKNSICTIIKLKCENNKEFEDINNTIINEYCNYENCVFKFKYEKKKECLLIILYCDVAYAKNFLDYVREKCTQRKWYEYNGEAL